MRSKPVIFTVYGVTLIVLILPVILNDFLPLIDINNHMARHYIALSIEDNAILKTYYDYTFSWFGNSTADLLRTAIGDHISVYNFARLTIGFYMVNFVFSVCVLNRVITGFWGLWPLLSVLVVYNGNFQWGLENYLVAAPFIIYAIAALVATENHSFMVRLLTISVFTGGLFVLHILLGLIFGAAVLGYELQKTYEQAPGLKWAYFRRNLLLGLPFVLFTGVYILLLGQTKNIDGSYMEFGTIQMRLNGIVSVSSEWFLNLLEFDYIWELAVLLFIYAIAILSAVRMGPRLKIDPRLKGLLAVLFLVSLLMPAWVEGVALIHYRTPFLLVAIFIASTTLTDIKLPALTVFIIIFVVISGGRIYKYHTDAKQHSNEIAALIQLLEKLPTGAKLMPIFGEKEQVGWRYHTAAFAVIERQALIPTLFQGVHGLKVRAAWGDYATTTVPPIEIENLTYSEAQGKYIFRKETPYKYATGAPLYFDHWDEKFSHVLLINKTDVALEDILPLVKIGSAGVYTLYENISLNISVSR